MQNGSGAKTTKKTVLKVDGWWGNETTKASQKYLETKIDGFVSNQPRKYKKYLTRASSAAWQFKIVGYKGGSLMVTALQKKLGIRKTGYMDDGTVRALQRTLKVGVNGYLDEATVKAWQKYLNNKLG